MNLGSIVIGSERADELKEWYRKTFNATEDDDGAFVFGAVRVFVFPHSDVHGQAAEPARILLNFYADDVRALEQELKDKGVRFVRPVTEEPFGLLGTIADPDGNYLQIFQPATVTTG
jgi:predicted enzyme related to lactoylglutathione lyase